MLCAVLSILNRMALVRASSWSAEAIRGANRVTFLSCGWSCNLEPLYDRHGFRDGGAGRRRRGAGRAELPQGRALRAQGPAAHVPRVAVPPVPRLGVAVCHGPARVSAARGRQVRRNLHRQPLWHAHDLPHGHRGPRPVLQDQRRDFRHPRGARTFVSFRRQAAAVDSRPTCFPLAMARRPTAARW